MKHSNSIGKKQVMDAMKSHGLTATRITDTDGERVWKLSDGRKFRTLADVAKAVKA